MAETADLRTVVLNDRHVALGGRMVPFAGYALPVQYPTGIIAEHKWTREHAGLFDVSHMGPSFLELAARTGDADTDHAAVAAIAEPLVSGDIRGLKPGQLRYTLLLNETGGTLDDLMVGRSPLYPGSLYIIVNAGTKEADFAALAAAAGSAATFTRADDGALLALQGPEAAAVLARLVPGAEALAFMHYGPFAWRGTTLIVSRSGYTGEDGFEILCAADRAAELWTTLLADARVRPAGLGARDSLRLEAGCALRPRLDDTVSPIEAGRLRRRQAPPRGRRLPRRRPHPRRARRRAGARARRPLRRGRPGARRRHHPRRRRAGHRPRHVGRLLAHAEPRHRARLRGARPRRSRHAPPGRRARPAASRRGGAAPLRSPSLRAESQAMTTRYTEDHEYIRLDGATATVGITAFAQDQLGDIVFVELPAIGRKLKKGDEAAVVESVKAASEIYAPASGTVAA